MPDEHGEETAPYIPQSTFPIQRLRGFGPTTVVVTPTNHIVVPKDIRVEVLPSNWHQILGRVRKSACTTCCPADPADPSRRIGCNQTDERTWKCNYCHRNNLPCSWAAGKLRRKKTVCLLQLKMIQLLQRRDWARSPQCGLPEPPMWKSATNRP